MKNPQVEESKLRECITMLGVLQARLVPCDYVGDESTIIEGIKPENADYVLGTAMRVLTDMLCYDERNNLK